jgi:hypothetical protein
MRSEAMLDYRDGERGLGRRTILAFAGLAALPGCGFIGNPHDSLPLSLADAGMSTANAEVPDGGVLVVLSYPARVAPEAQSLLHSRYADAWIGSMVAHEPYPQALDNALLKTAYHVTELYAELAARLPQGQVIVQPAEVVLDGTGGFSQRLPAGHLPAVVRVDFLAYCSPGVLYDGRPTDGQTLGREFTPLICVTTDPSASPATRGALMGVDRLPVLPFAPGAQPSVLAQLAAKGANQSGLQVATSIRRPARPGTYTALPFVEFQIGEDEWAAHLAAPRPRTSPMARHIASYAAMIAEYATSLDPTAALHAQRLTYRASFDPRAVEALEPTQVRLLDRFAATETAFLDRTGSAYLTGLYDGEFGASVRLRISAERTYQAQHTRADAMAAFAILAGGLAGGLSGAGYVNPSVTGIASRTHTTLSDLATNHSAAMAGLASQQATVAIEMDDGIRTIQASSLSDLRQRLSEIYRTQFPV